MDVTIRNDDFLKMGNNQNNGNQNSNTVVFPGKFNNQDYIERELMRIVAINKKYNLAENPELLGNMLEDLQKKIKGGNILEILKDPIVYGGISVILLGIILFKISKKRKK